MPRSVALLAVLALAAPLQAEVTLALKELPARVQSGTSLPLLVDVQGATPGQPLTVSVSIRGKRVFAMEKAMAAPSEAVHLTIPVQALQVAEDLWIQAQCGPVQSLPRQIRALPEVAPGSLDAGLEDKEAFTPAGKRWKSASSSSSSSSSPAQDRLSPLPRFALESIAGFSGPDPLRYLSKGLHRRAAEATRELRIQGEIDNEEIMDLVLRHPNVRTITLGRQTPNLSPEGILAALRQCRKLRTLVNSSEVFTFPYVRALFETHEALVGLRRPDTHEVWGPGPGYTDEEVALLLARMEELEFKSRNLRDATIQRFTSLKVLHLTDCDSFRGDDLPSGLTRLGIKFCRQFSGQRLPSGLVELELRMVDAFSGSSPLPNLRKLSISADPRNVEVHAALTALVRSAPMLTHVSMQSPSPSQIAALPPGLTDLDIWEDRDTCALADRDLARFTRLEHLSVYRSTAFTGKDLPLSLRSMEVHECPGLRSEVLGHSQLTRLVASCCRNFTGAGLPTTLRVLSVEACAAGAEPLIMRTLDHLNNLEQLLTRDWSPAHGDVARLADHPALRTAVFGDHYSFWQWSAVKR